MNDIEILPLEENHIDPILEISILSFHTPWSREAFMSELDNKFARYVVAKKDGIVVGYGGMWLIIDEGHITNIAIHPEYRSIGIASMILEALLDICKLELADSATLEVRRSNLIAQNLYKKYGFVEDGIRKSYYEDNKEDAVIMWKRNI